MAELRAGAWAEAQPAFPEPRSAGTRAIEHRCNGQHRQRGTKRRPQLQRLPPFRRAAAHRCRTIFAPAAQRPSACSPAQGNCWRSGSHASSSCDSSLPLTPRPSSWRAIALSRGSPGGASPASSSSNRSRHQASRIAPSAGSVVVATTSAIARSRFQSVANAGRTVRGIAASAVRRSESSVRSAIGDGLHRLDHLRGLDQRHLLEVRGVRQRYVDVGHAQHRRVEIVEAFGHRDGDDLG